MSDLLVESISNKRNSMRIAFQYPIIFDHAKIVDALTNKRIELKHIENLAFDRITLTIGGYDTGYGFQYSIGGIGNPDVGKRIYVDGSKYPTDAKKQDRGTMVSELSFSFREKGKKFKMRFIGNLAEIRPKPSLQVVNEFVSLLKKNIIPSPNIFLSSAREKLRSAKIDFLAGRYRSVVHNIYYTMFSVVKSLRLKEGKQRSLEHKKLANTLEQILSEIQQGTSTLEVLGMKQFQRINLDEYSTAIEEVRALRDLADYRAGFEAGGSEAQLAEMLSKAEELVAIGEYIVEGGMCTKKGKIVLHYPTEQEEPDLPHDILNSVDHMLKFEDNLIIRSMLVLVDDFNATSFAFRLLTRDDVYFAAFSPRFFRGGTYAKYEKGCYSYQDEPEKDFIELSRKTARRWSAIIKPPRIEELGACKENIAQELCLFFNECFLEVHIFPDGRIYLFSSLDERNLRAQLKAFRDIVETINKTVSENWSDYSITISKIEILSK